MNYLEQLSLATDKEFVNRVQQAAIEAAIAIANEGASEKSQVDSQRLNLARQILLEPHRMAQTLAYGIVSVLKGNEDKDIASAIEEVWNNYAGVNANLVAIDVSTPAKGIVTKAMLEGIQSAEPEPKKTLFQKLKERV